MFNELSPNYISLKSTTPGIRVSETFKEMAVIRYTVISTMLFYTTWII